MINKISCLGNTASGKSYLAKKLAQELNLPYFSLDLYYWQENWTPITKTEFLAIEQKITANEKWVLDGTFAEVGLSARFEQSDCVVFLESKPLGCLKRALKRRGNEKDRLPNGADDQKIGFFRSLNFLFDILTFNLRDRRKILKLAHRFPDKLVILQDWGEEEALILQLTNAHNEKKGE